MSAAARMNMPVLETLPTRLMPDLLERLQDASPLMVFDPGYAVHETVEYFGNRRCRLHFSGLHELLGDPPAIVSDIPFGQLADKARQDEELYLAWRARFKPALQFAPGTRFDLCLFWDIFNYLDDMALKAFMDVLAPYVGTGTFAHAYILLKPEPGVLNREYGILEREQICARQAYHGHLPSFPRPQARVTSLLKGLTVNHSVLRRDGLLEVALKSS